MGKRIAIVAAILVIAALFGGCGGQEREKPHWRFDRLGRRILLERLFRVRRETPFPAGTMLKILAAEKAVYKAVSPMVQYNVA